MHLNRMRRDNAGAVFVEAAIGLLLLITVIGGVVNVGWALKERMVMLQAAKVAARAAVRGHGGGRTDATNCGSAVAYAKEFVQGAGFDPAQFTFRFLGVTDTFPGGPDVARYIVRITRQPGGLVGWGISLLGATVTSSYMVEGTSAVTSGDHVNCSLSDTCTCT